MRAQQLVGNDTGMTRGANQRRAPKTLSRRPSRKRQHLSNQYWDITHRPLQCLVFLIPMVAAYELGMAISHGNVPIEQRPGLAAQQLLYWFFSLFGVTGVYLPGVLLIVILLGWHIASRNPWEISLGGLARMAGESVVLAIPFLLLNELLREAPAIQAVVGGDRVSAFDNLLLSVGAGLYEELVFRLIVISLLYMLLVDIARLREVTGVALAVILSSLMFSAHHFHPIGSDAWSTPKFAFFAACGAYLAAVFVLRGFGLAVGCHAFYDIVVSLMLR